MAKRSLRIAAAALVLLVLVPGVWGEGSKESGAAATSAQATPAGKYKEAPMLAKLVQEGKLPPVAERLPPEPLVVKPVDSVGKYGGTWYRWNDHPRMYCWEPLVKMDVDGSLHANVATSWEISPDYTKFTFHIRKGIQWSDGVPFTTEDIMFYWIDIAVNEEYARISRGGDGLDMTAPDPYTLVITFPKPQPTFMARQSTQWGGFGFELVSWPKHYLKQFHPAYTKKEDLDKMVKDAGVASWPLLLESKYWVEQNPEVPVITAWQQTTKASEATQAYVRNPYYWKVDTAGNQLPYIDRAERPLKADHEVGILKAAAGEIDYTGESYNISDLPVLTQNAAKGNYSIIKIKNDYSPTANCLYISQNYAKDEEVAEILRNLSFRKAISVAMNRSEINEFISLGQSVPCQATVPPSHPAGSQELYTYMTQYDPAAANKFLDEAGLSKKDSEGFRMTPSGKKFTFVLSPRSDNNIKCAEILRKHFESVGVRTSISTEDLTFWMQNKNNGLHMVSMYSLGNGNPELSDTWWIPINANCYWAPLNGAYISSGGKEGVKPVGDIAEITAKYQSFIVETDAKKRAELIKWVVDKVTRNLYMIGTVSSPPSPAIVKKNFHNVPTNQVIFRASIEVWDYSQLWKE